jgi:hypothetical protein
MEHPARRDPCLYLVKDVDAPVTLDGAAHELERWMHAYAPLLSALDRRRMKAFSEKLNAAAVAAINAEIADKS